MRRVRQLLPPEETEQILRNGKECVLALNGEDGPYSVPVNYVIEGRCVYFHSAKEGHKIDLMRKDSRVSLCVIDKDTVVPEEFTTYFRSVIAFGKAYFVENDDEKTRVLKLLCDKYCAGISPTDEINRLLKAVAIIRIDIDHMTGKEAIELVRMREHQN